MTESQKRTCGNCCAYEDGECMNGLGEVKADSRCDQHKTWGEDRREDEAVNRFFVSINLPPRKPIE